MLDFQKILRQKDNKKNYFLMFNFLIKNFKENQMQLIIYIF